MRSVFWEDGGVLWCGVEADIALSPMEVRAESWSIPYSVHKS